MNRFSEQLALEYDEALGGYPVSLPRDFRQALAEVEGRLDREELRQWAEEGAAIARHSLRSWEAAAEFYRASPSLLENMPFAAVRQWAEAGRDLAEESATLAAAFFKAAAAGVSFLNPQQMRDWAALGKQLYKGTWKSSSLASQFFEVSPELLPHISMPEMRALTRFVDTLAARSYELAS